MGLFLDCQSASKLLYSNRLEYLDKLNSGVYDKEKYDSKIEKIEEEQKTVYSSINLRFNVDLSPEEAAQIFNESFGSQGFAMKRDVSAETAKQYMAKAKDLYLRMQHMADRTTDVFKKVDISKSNFNQYALNLLDYTSDNYLEQDYNNEIINTLNGSDNIKKGELINRSITNLLSTDFSKYENISDEELLARGPAIAQELMRLGCVDKMYHAAVKEGIIAQENNALLDRLTKLSNYATSFFEQLDMRMSMMVQPLSAYVDYNSIKSHGENGTQLLSEELISKYKEDPAKAFLLTDYNKMLFKYTDYISNTDYNARLRETFNNILFNYGAKEGEFKLVVEDKYSPDKFRSFDNVHDACEYMGDEAVFSNGKKPSVYLVNGEDEPVGFTIDPSVNDGTGIKLYSIDLDEETNSVLRKLADYGANRSYLKTMYQRLSSENSKTLKYSNSDEYKNILNQMQELYKLTSDQNPSEETLTAANQELIALGEKCNLYLRKKEKDFAKDGKLNDRSLNRVDIVKEIAKFANTACFGKRTPELSNAQQLNRLETEQIPDWREAGKFRFTFSASPEIFLSNLKKTRDALYKTNSVFTKDSKEFQLVQHELDQAIANIEKVNEILGPESSLDKIKPFLRNVKASLDDYINVRTKKNNELTAKGKAPNDRTMTRLQIAGELLNVTKEVVPEPILPNERIIRRLRSEAINTIFKKDPHKASEKLLSFDDDIPTLMKNDTIKGWLDSKHKYQTADILHNFKDDLKQIKEITALDKALQDPQKAGEFKKLVSQVRQIDKNLAQKGLPSSKNTVSAEAKLIKANEEAKPLQAQNNNLVK